MDDYYVTELKQTDARAMQDLAVLLHAEGIRMDAHLDYCCGIYNEKQQLIATGSSYLNTLRCFAVASDYRGNGLLNSIVTHLLARQFEHQNGHVFVYTRPQTAAFFRDLGFYTIAELPEELVFLENTKEGFSSYLDTLLQQTASTLPSAALVLNANPFTRGHLVLVSKAAKENALVHLFLVREDCSFFPYTVRKELVQKGTAMFDNICYHDCSSYLISKATFPSYFQKDRTCVIRQNAMLDARIFCQIAKKLNITRRYVGEEPKSMVTGIYNEILKKELPMQQISCIEVKRACLNHRPISASDVRLAIQTGNEALLKQLVPDTTYQYLTSPQAAPVIAAIRAAANVIHY